MKLKKIMATIVVLCASCFYALAQDVTIEAKNVRLEQILDQISDQTGCSFYYSRPTVNPDDIYSLSVKELDLSSTLSILFREKDVAFDIKNDKVYLTARKDTERDRSDARPYGHTGAGTPGDDWATIRRGRRQLQLSFRVGGSRFT